MAGGGLLVGVTFQATGCASTKEDYSELTAWIRIAPDGVVTIAPPHMEIGQAVATSQTQLVAEELDADWSKVSIRTPEASPRYGYQFAGGSQTITLSWKPLRQAGATARAMLIEAAAKQWNVPAAECRTEPGLVVHPASNRKLGYGALASDAAKLSPPDKVQLKAKEDWRFIGKPVPKHETPAVVMGKQIYGMDFKLPGMVYASIEHYPTLDAKAKYDKAAALKVPGVLKIIEVPAQDSGGENPGGAINAVTRGGIAVVARDTWSAFKGREALAVQWDEPNANESSDMLADALTKAMAGPGVEFHSIGDLATAVKAPDLVAIDVQYDMPFLAHMMMEPANAVVQVKDGRVDCWGPTQEPNQDLAMIAKVLGVAAETVSFQAMPGGGGFGRRGINASAEAALIAAQMDGVPVKVVWKREDETQLDHFRPVSRSRVRITADKNGNLIGWDHHHASPWEESKRTTDSTTLGTDFLYQAPAASFRHTTIPTGIEIGAMRGVNSVYNVFASESAIDELAEKLGKDPLELRMKWFETHRDLEKISPPPHGTEGLIEPSTINFQRMIGVLTACRDKIGWSHKPGAGHGMGLATYNHLGTHCAVAAEVQIDDKGKLRIKRLVAAVDMGTVVNPLGAQAQIQGGLVFGLSGVLRERVTIVAGKAEQTSFSDYSVITMPEVPKIDVILIDSGAFPSGAGEVAVPGPGPAVANAIFAATGRRIRAMPIFFTRPELDPNS